jgi:hypothetical protein
LTAFSVRALIRQNVDHGGAAVNDRGLRERLIRQKVDHSDTAISDRGHNAPGNYCF